MAASIAHSRAAKSETKRTINPAAERAGYRAEAGAGGAKRHVKITRDGAQPFSFIVNKGDLLFYLRSPALVARPELRERAVRQFGNRVQLHPDKHNEATIRIGSAAEAERVADFVF